MNRFEDTLERDLHVIADRATPSPDAWSSILTRIADEDPIQETEIIMLTENTTTTRRWPLVALAAAVAIVLLIAGIVVARSGDDDQQPADTPPPPPDTEVVVPEVVAPPVDDAEPVDEAQPVDDAEAVDEAQPEPEPEPEPVAEVVEPDPVDDATDLTSGSRPGIFLEPGPYRSDLLGVPIRFEAPVDLQIHALEPEGIWLSSTGPGDVLRGLTMSRVGSWFAPDEAADPSFTVLGSIAADAIDEWIEATGITVDDAQTVELGGRTAQYRSFTVPGDLPNTYDDPDACHYPEWQPCFWANSGSADLLDPTARDFAVLGTGGINHMWLVEMDGYEPMLVSAYANQPDMSDERVTLWLDEIVPQIIDSIEFGEPTYAVPGGSASLSRQVVANGTWQDEGYSEEPGANEGEFIVTSSTRFDGDVTGDLPTSGTRTRRADGGSNGTNTNLFEGTIEGIGSGTLTVEEAYIAKGIFQSVGRIGSGTGDFAGITGTQELGDTGGGGTYVWTLDVPLVTPAETATREFSLTATTTNTGFTETGNPSIGATYTGAQDYEGEIVGTETFRGNSLLEPNGTGSGNDVGVFSGSIDGVGSGTLTIESTWRDDPTTGQYVGMALITAGTGDFTGASGFARYNSPNAMQTGTVAMQLVLPVDG